MGTDNLLAMYFSDESYRSEFLPILASMALDIVPVVGNIKSAAELDLGHDYITEHDLSTEERVLLAACLLLPLVKHLKSVKVIAKSIYQAYW